MQAALGGASRSDAAAAADDVPDPQGWDRFDHFVVDHFQVSDRVRTAGQQWFCIARVCAPGVDSHTHCGAIAFVRAR